MRYSVITVTDGNFLIRSEWGEKNGAIKAFHSLATILWADNAGFTEGYIAIIDGNLDIVEGYKEHITHTQTPAAETVEE